MTFELERLEYGRTHGELRLIDCRGWILGRCPAQFVEAGVAPGEYEFQVKRTGTGWRVEGVLNGRLVGYLQFRPLTLQRAFIVGDHIRLEVPD